MLVPVPSCLPQLNLRTYLIMSLCNAFFGNMVSNNNVAMLQHTTVSTVCGEAVSCVGLSLLHQLPSKHFPHNHCCGHVYTGGVLAFVEVL